ncbi:spore germination protein GerW family protein, partial [Alkalihalophilus pseudofirmus]
NMSGGSGNQSQGQQGQGQQLPFGGGSGAGVSITPIAFLIVNSSGVKMLHLDESTHLYEKILELAPQAVDKIQQMFSKKNESNQQLSGN